MGEVPRAARMAKGKKRGRGVLDDVLEIDKIDNCPLSSQSLGLEKHSTGAVEMDGLETSSPDAASRAADQPNHVSIAVETIFHAAKFTAGNTGQNTEVGSSLLETDTRDPWLHRKGPSGPWHSCILEPSGSNSAAQGFIGVRSSGSNIPMSPSYGPAK